MELHSKSGNHLWFWPLLVELLFVSPPLRAQDPTEVPASSTDEVTATGAVIGGDTVQNDQASTEPPTEPSTHSDTENAELREIIAKQNIVNEEMRQRLETLENKFDESEAEDLELYSTGGDQLLPNFNIYGFFDLNLYISDIPDSPEKNTVPDDLSFVVNRLNLYFSSQMTETLSALVEIRYTFLPLGTDIAYEETILHQVPYQRVDTTVLDPFTTERIALGGLLIERVQLTWKPIEAFGIVAGRFLTPYGIWNVDHGSPVRIPILSPYFMIREFIPSAQTGIQVFGRFFPFDSTYLDYALTVSNNRGPAESVYDLSDNKAFGFRLKGAYEVEDFSSSLGGYVYYGTVRDIKKRVADYLPRFRLAIDEQYAYEELSGSLDLLIKLFDIRLQVEFVRGMVVYSEREHFKMPILNISTQTGFYGADFLRTGIYALLGYEILLNLGQSQAFLMPYINFEYNEPNDTFQSLNEYMIRGGLNFKPSAYVTLKAEVMHGVLPYPLNEVDKAWSYQTYSSQLAVSF